MKAVADRVAKQCALHPVCIVMILAMVLTATVPVVAGGLFMGWPHELVTMSQRDGVFHQTVRGAWFPVTSSLSEEACRTRLRVRFEDELRHRRDSVHEMEQRLEKFDDAFATGTYDGRFLW
jgi:hypothetical protein